MDITKLKQIRPHYRNLDDDQIVRLVHRNDYPDWSEQEVAQALGVKAKVPEKVTPERTWGEAAADTGRGLLSGGAGLVGAAGDLYGLATGDFDNTASRLGKEGQQYWQEGQSDALKAKKKGRSEAIAAADGVLGKFGAAVGETITDPALMVDALAENVATMLPAGLVGRGVAAAKYGASMANAAKVGGVVAPEVAAAAAQQAGTWGTRAMMGTGAVQQGADVAGGIYDQGMKTPMADLAQNPEFVERVAAGESPEAVQHDLAVRAARLTFPAAAGVSALTQMMPGANALERAIVGKGARITADAPAWAAKMIPNEAIRAGAKSVVVEPVQEPLEEGLGQFAGNVANRAVVNPNQDLGQDVGENAGMGFVGGLGMGAAGAPFSAAGAKPAVEDNGPLSRGANVALGNGTTDGIAQKAQAEQDQAAAQEAAKQAAKAKPQTPVLEPQEIEAGNARLAELEAIGKGRPAQEVVTPDGQKVTIPAEPGRYFTPEEKDQYDALVRLRDEGALKMPEAPKAPKVEPVTPAAPAAPGVSPVAQGGATGAALEVDPLAKIHAQGQRDLDDIKTAGRVEAAIEAKKNAPAPRFTEEDINAARQMADGQNLTPRIEALFGEGKTALNVAKALKDELASLSGQQERMNFVGAVRASLGIPSTGTPEGMAAFKEWQAEFKQRKGGTPDGNASAPSATVPGSGDVRGGDADAGMGGVGPSADVGGRGGMDAGGRLGAGGDGAGVGGNGPRGNDGAVSLPSAGSAKAGGATAGPAIRANAGPGFSVADVGVTGKQEAKVGSATAMVGQAAEKSLKSLADEMTKRQQDGEEVDHKEYQRRHNEAVQRMVSENAEAIADELMAGADAPSIRSLERDIENGRPLNLASVVNQATMENAGAIMVNEDVRAAVLRRLTGDAKTERPAAAKPAEAQQEQGAQGKAPLPIPQDLFGQLLSEAAQSDTPYFSVPAQTVRVEEKVEGAGEMLEQAQADARVASWKARAKEQGKSGKNAGKVVISLFDASGEWSKPWREAGYDVWQFDIQHGDDINDFSAEYLLEKLADDGLDTGSVFAILAAPPCTDFSSSGAHAWAAKDADGRTQAAVKLVGQTLATVELLRPAVWALENPVGRIGKMTGLPKPLLTFQPSNFGAPYSKRTLLWGDFQTDLPTANVRATEGSKITTKLSGSDKYGRSLTPEGFAYAFFMANNAMDMGAAVSLAAEFKGVPVADIQAALDAGHTAEAIKTAIEDQYHDQDMDGVKDALADLVGKPNSKAAGSDKTERGEFGPILRGFKGDAQGAIAALTKLQDGEAVAALNHPQVGDIDLVWGKAPTASIEGYGLAKITEKHPEVLSDLQGFLNRLHKDNANSGKNRVRLVDDSGNAVVSLEWKGSGKTWLLTAYENVVSGTGATMDTASREAKDDTASLDAGQGESVAPVTKADKPAPSGNKIFTDEMAEAARQRLKAKLGRLNSGIDPETLMDGITLAGYHVEKGARKFAQFAKAMLEDLGDGAKPYLKSWYMGIKYDPRAAAFAGEMTTPAEVDAFNVDDLGAPDEAPEAAQTEFDHNGTRIYPAKVKDRETGEVSAMWAVETADNKQRRLSGERVLGGDTLHDTPEKAKQAAERQASEDARREADRQEQERGEQERKQAEEQRKEANRGKSIAERRADAVLDKPTKLPASAGLGAGTKREAMQKAVEQGRAIVEASVHDAAAKKRDQEAVEQVSKKGYILGLSNENIPVVKAGLEAQARLKANDYTKPEYRVYANGDRSGGFWEITKTEYDYAKSLQAGAQAKPDTQGDGETKQTAQAAQATGDDLPDGWTKGENGFTKRPVYRFNQDVGQPFAVVTQVEGMKYEVQIRHGDKQLDEFTTIGALMEVLPKARDKVREFTQGDAASHKDPGESAEEATKGVVTQSLKKAARAEETTPGEMRKWLLAEIDKRLLTAPDRADFDEAVSRVGEKDAVSMFTGNGPLGKGAEGFITFDVPGDGTFKVRNSVRGLMEFRKNVSSSPGFKDNGQNPKPAPTNGNIIGGSKTDSIINMIEEGDFEAARDFAQAHGIDLASIKVPRGDKKHAWERFLKDGTVPPQPRSLSKEWQFVDNAGSFVPDAQKRQAVMERVANGSFYEVTVKGALDGTRATYEITKDGKPYSKMTTPGVFSEVMRQAEDAMPQANNDPAPSKAKDTGWDMAGVGYGGKRYIGRNITTEDGREIVARIYERAGVYEEAEVRVNGSPKFSVTDRNNAQAKADAFIKTLLPDDKASADRLFTPEKMTSRQFDAWIRQKATIQTEQFRGDRNHGGGDDGVGYIHLSGSVESAGLNWAGTSQGMKDNRDTRLVFRTDDNQLVWFDDDSQHVYEVAKDDPRLEITRPEPQPKKSSDNYEEVSVEVDGVEYKLMFDEPLATISDQDFNDKLYTSGVVGSAMVEFRKLRAKAVADAAKGQTGTEAKAEEPKAAQAGSRRDPTKVSAFNPYIDGDVVTIDGKDWTVKTDTPGWYLTTTGDWRGQHPTLRGIKSMNDLIAQVEKAATAEVVQPPQAISEAQARQRLAWRDLGQKDGTKTWALFFKDEDGRGMQYGKVIKFGGARWEVEGHEGGRYEGLRPAKDKAADLAIERLRRDGYVAKATEPEHAESRQAADVAPAAPPQAPESKASDDNVADEFGEKLPPARRAMAAKLTEALSESDIASKPLSVIWPAVENDAIEDTFAAAVAHAARAAIPAKPRVAYKVKVWAKKVMGLRQLVGHILKGTVSREEFLEMAKQRDLRDWTAKVLLLEQIDRSLWGRIGEVNDYPDAVTYLEGGAAPVPAPYFMVEIDGKRSRAGGRLADHIDTIKTMLSGKAPEQRMQFEIRQERSGARKVFINKKGDSTYRRLMEFDTVADARKAMAERYDDLVAAWESVKERDNISEKDLRTEENRPRAGRDYRKGRDVSVEEFQETFGFRGGEFGKWVGQGKGAQERQFMLNSAYDAFMDLANILGIPPKAVSLEGTLGIAFGSRGGGWASAHFEPSNQVINLTKPRGAGALAHEWFHALDNYFARKRGGEVAFTGSQVAYRDNNYITHKPVPNMVRKDGRGSALTKERLEALRKSNGATGYLAESEWIEDPKHPSGVRPVVEAKFADLVKALNESPMWKRSRLLDGVKSAETDGYWSRTLERAARSFESFIQAQMLQDGYHNDFLVNIRNVADVEKNPDRFPYPTQSELAPIADAFKSLFDTIENKEVDGGKVALFSRGKPNPDLLADIAKDMDDVDALLDDPDILAALRQHLASQDLDMAYPRATFEHVEMVRKGAEKILSGWKNAPDLKVLASFADAPKEALDEDRRQRANGATGSPDGFLHGGVLYLVAPEVQTQADVARLMAHEGVGHFGLRGFYGQQFGDVLSQAWRARRRDIEAHNRDKHAFDTSTPKGAALATEEWLVAMAETNPQMGFVRRAVAIVRGWLRRVAPSLRVTDDEVIAKFIIPARQWVEDGKGPGGGGGGGRVRFSRAFHGTPHRGITKFSTDKIGTGEGAQAYGWGLYFASKRDIAEHYRETLANQSISIDGEVMQARRGGRWLNFAAEKGLAPWDAEAIDDVLNNFWPNRGAESLREAVANWRKAGQDERTARRVEALADRVKITKGQLYEVEIPEDSEMLLWDKPLSEQPDFVTEQLKDVIEYEGAGDYFMRAVNGQPSKIGLSTSGVTGQSLYKRLTEILGSDEAASMALSSSGIKGIKYMDGTSRDSKGASHNYVIFDGDHVEIKQTHFSRGGIDFGINRKVDLKKTLPGRAAIERSQDGPRIAGGSVALVFPQESERVEYIPTNGERVIDYAIMPRDGTFDVLGNVELVLDKDGMPISLLDINVSEQQKGVGAQVIGAILGNMPNRELNISNIIQSAQGFWEKMGVPLQNHGEGAAYDGVLTYDTYAEAQNRRGAPGVERTQVAADAGARGPNDAGAAGEGARNLGSAEQGLIEGPAKGDAMFSRGGAAAQALADKFKAETGEDIGRAGVILAGIEVRNAMRDNGKPAGPVPTMEKEKSPFTKAQMKMLDQWLAMRNPSTKYLFHTTPAANLQAIAKEGLKPGAAQRHVGVSGAGRVSLAGNEATASYYGAQGDAMLRVSKKHKFDDLGPDVLAGEGAYTTGKAIPPEALEVKVGRKWVPLTEHVKGEAKSLPERIDVDGKSRPTTNSLGQPIHTTEEKVRNFWRWFGDSKVVDDQGRPKVVYHGTRSDIESFDAGRVSYFGADAVFASGYAEGFSGRPEGANVLPVYLAVSNPKWLPLTDSAKLSLAEIDSFASDGSDGVFGYRTAWGAEGIAPIAERNGQVVTEVIPFTPTQIKSAIGNDGNFSPDTSNVMFSRGGKALPTVAEVKRSASDALGDFVGSAGAQVDWLDRTFKTQYAKAQKLPEFGRVFNKVQQYLESTSTLANGAADLAPSILPKMESVSDVMRGGLKGALLNGLNKEDGQALSQVAFEGTLEWNRQEDGTLIRNDDLRIKADGMTVLDKAQEMLRRRMVTPERIKAWRGLPRGLYDATVINAYEREVLTPGVVFSDAELKSVYKLTDAQIKHYRQFRAAVDESLDQLTAAEAVSMVPKAPDRLKAMAQTPEGRAELRDAIEEFMGDKDNKVWHRIADKFNQAERLKERGYAPLSRFGQFYVHLVNEGTGETEYFGLAESKQEANRLARELRKDYGDGFKIEQGVMSQEQHKLMSAVPVDALELFANALGADESEVMQRYLALTKNNRSVMKRMIQRKGRAGFAQDASRVLASFITSNARAASSALNVKDAKELARTIQAGDVQDEAIKLIEAVTEPQESGATIRSLMFFNFIGGSIASAAVNLTQPVMMTIPYLSQWGGAVKAAARLGAAAKMVAAGIPKGEKYRALAQALKQAEDDGIVSPQEIHHLLNRAAGGWARNHPAWQKFSVLWGAPFGLAEVFNRRVSFIAAFQTAQESGMADPYAFAEKAVIETQGLYNAGNKPNVARGAAGATVMTFKQYSIHYMEWLSRMAKSGPEGKKAAVLALALLVLMAGAQGLPFMDDLDDVLETAGQAMGYDLSMKRTKRDFLHAVLGETLGDVALRGVSGFAGMPIDVSVRMGMGNLLPATDLFKVSNKDKERSLAEIAGPGGALFMQGVDATNAALKGDVKRALLGAAPKAVQNAAIGAEVIRSGEFRNTRDERVMDVSPVGGAFKMVGFQPNEVAKDSQRLQDLRQSETLAKETKARIMKEWARAIADGDTQGQADALKARDEWNEKNPDMPIRVRRSEAVKKARQMKMDRDARFLKTVGKERREAVAKELNE